MIPPQDAELQKYFANKVWESGFPAFVPIIGKVFNPLHSHSVLHAVTLGGMQGLCQSPDGTGGGQSCPPQAGREGQWCSSRNRILLGAAFPPACPDSQEIPRQGLAQE